MGLSKIGKIATAGIQKAHDFDAARATKAREKQPVVVVQCKGNGDLQDAMKKYQRLGYELISQEPQGRKRMVLTFRAPEAA